MKEIETELIQLKKEKNDLESKSQSNYGRFEDSINKIKSLEDTIKEQEAIIVKRGQDCNKLLKENGFYKD